MWNSTLSLFQRFAAKRMFSRWSPIYEEEVLDNDYSAADEVSRVGLKYLAQQNLSEPVIADVGIGTGLVAQQIHDSYPCRIRGLDFSEEMLSLCSARDVTELLIKCDVGKDRWPLEEASVDMICSAGLLEYLTPSMLQHYLDESSRTLQQKGTLIFTYIPLQQHEKKMGIWHGHSGSYLSCRYESAEIERLLAGKGFTVLEHTPPFKGCVFQDESFYEYRLIAARKN